MSSLGYSRVIAVSCQMSAHVTIMVNFTTPTTPSLKTATHGNVCSCLIASHPLLTFNYLNYTSFILAVCVRSAAGTAASLPAPVCVWQPVTHTMWHLMAAAFLSWVTASMCWRVRAVVYSASLRRMCPAGAPGSPVQNLSPSAWGTPSFTCWEVGGKRRLDDRRLAFICFRR